MKKTMLWSTLFTLMSAQIQAEGIDNNTISQVQTIAAANEAQNNFPKTAPQAVAPNPTTATPIDCDYKIPASMKTIDPVIVTKWSENATIQAFQFDLNSIDAQLQKLRACFTDQGWVNFKNALQQSGNIDAIKSKKLNMTAKLDGESQLTEIKENQWKIALPLQVIYHNDQEKALQTLTIHLLIVRKVSGDLGILQLAAVPRTVKTITNPQDLVPTTRPTNMQQLK